MIVRYKTLSHLGQRFSFKLMGSMLIRMDNQNSIDYVSIISLPSSRAGFYFFSTAKKSKQKMPPLTRKA